MSADGGGEGEADGVLAAAVDRIAHQLKNPLQAITVNLEVLRIRAAGEAGDDPEREVERLAGIVNENVRILDRRIGMLVDLARRSPDGPLRSVRLGRFVREASTAFRLDEGEGGRDLPVEVTSGSEDPEVRVRAGWLLAVLLELARSPGASEEEAALRVTADGEGAAVSLVVPGRGGSGERGGAGEDLLRRLSEMARCAGGELSDDEAGLTVRFSRG